MVLLAFSYFSTYNDLVLLPDIPLCGYYVVTIWFLCGCYVATGVHKIWIFNPKLSDKMREILQHFDKVSKISKLCLYTLQENLEQYNHP